MSTTSLRITSMLLLALLATACTASSGEGSSQAQDPCSPANLPGSVQVLNEYMRQVDNQVQLATVVTGSDIRLVIEPMERIRGKVQDQAVGACLDELKRLQLQYVEAVLEVVQPASGISPDATTLADGLQEARQYRDQYTLEMSRLLGVTATP